MYKVALCEDEQAFFEAQEKICRDILEKLNIGYSISVFESSAAFWTAFSKGARYDLILLDIIMDKINGMELAQKIRGYDSDAAIVFITSSPEFAMQSYDVSALHYLMKPLNGDKLEEIVKSDYERRFRRQFIIIKSGTQNLRISASDIVCFENVGRRVMLTLTDGGTVDCSGKLTEIWEGLPKETFIRCHVGYIVNLKNIKKLTRTEAVSVSGKTIPVSRVYSQAAQTTFMKQMWEV